MSAESVSIILHARAECIPPPLWSWQYTTSAPMRSVPNAKTEGFLLTEILIVVTIFLIILAIAVPNLLCSRMPTILTITAQSASPLN